MTEQEFTQFYKNNLDKVFRFIYLRVDTLETAEDLTAQVFFKYWQSENNSNNSKLAIKNPQAFIYQIARNQIIDFYRRKKNALISLDELREKGIEIPQESFNFQIELSFEMENLKKSLQKIKPIYSEIIIWHYVNELSIKEIANILQKNENNVRVLLHRALESLKAQINTDKNTDKHG